MLTKTRNASKTTSAPPTLPDWRTDAKVRELHQLIAQGENGLPGVEARAQELKAQLDTASAKLSEATSLQAFGLADAASLDALQTEVERLTHELQAAEKTAATVRQGLTQAKTALPTVEAMARKRVAGECEAVYVKAAERFSEAVEEASRAYMALIGLHDQLGHAFPGGDDGEGFYVRGLGMIRPPAAFDAALRTPEGSWTPTTTALYAWRTHMRQMRGTPQDE